VADVLAGSLRTVVSNICSWMSLICPLALAAMKAPEISRSSMSGRLRLRA
jgi:hypothetical protein